MKRIVHVFAGALTLALALTSCTKKAEIGAFTLEGGKFKIGVSVDLPPFEYYAEDGKTALGFDMELGRELAKRFGLEAEIIDTDWDGLFAGLHALYRQRTGDFA